MAALLRCEQCGKETKTDTGFIAVPPGWVQVRERLEGRSEEVHFCGWQCVSRYSAGLAATEREREADAARACQLKTAGLRCRLRAGHPGSCVPVAEVD